MNVALAQMPKHGNKKVLIPRLLPWGVPDSVTASSLDCPCSSSSATERLSTVARFVKARSLPRKVPGRVAVLLLKKLHFLEDAQTFRWPRSIGGAA